MASLWFRTANMTFDSVARPLPRFKAMMAARMQSGGFTNVVNNDAEVAGGRQGRWTSMAPLHRVDLDGRRQEFILVIMCVADNVDVAKSNTSDVLHMLSWNDGLW
jgi:hypothetical protein